MFRLWPRSAGRPWPETSGVFGQERNPPTFLLRRNGVSQLVCWVKKNFVLLLPYFFVFDDIKSHHLPWPVCPIFFTKRNSLTWFFFVETFRSFVETDKNFLLFYRFRTVLYDWKRHYKSNCLNFFRSFKKNSQCPNKKPSPEQQDRPFVWPATSGNCISQSPITNRTQENHPRLFGITYEQRST